MHHVRVVIIGAGGYTGGELIALLLMHPHVHLAALMGSEQHARDRPTPIDHLHPRLRGQTTMPVLPTDLDEIERLAPEAVFLATPHEISAALVPAVLALRPAPVVFDLSGAFRLPASLYPQHYGFEHPCPQWVEAAAYGLAEWYASAIARAPLVAVPGCYPTAALLALLPLTHARALASDRPVIVDAVSGVSGAGRTPSARTHFCEVSLQPYGVLNHRHTPEIETYAGTPVIFTPHLGPFNRGILCTIHAELVPGWTTARVGETFRSAYRSQPFIRLMPAGSWPTLAAVERTNYCDLAWACDERRQRVILFSALDNLVKGAAGQAVQCLNIRFGLAPTAGLSGVGT